MFIWIILFVVVLIISFVLAFRSMSDYYDQVTDLAVPYSAFLIGKPEVLTPALINQICLPAKKDELMVSFERLYRGNKRALVVFAPVAIIGPHKNTLGLTELEDYSLKLTPNKENVAAWEVGLKKADGGLDTVEGKVLNNIPDLLSDEELWWQVVVQPQKGENYRSTVRAVVFGHDANRTEMLRQELSKIGQTNGLAVLPQAYSSSQIVQYYQKRALPQLPIGGLSGKNIQLILTAEKIKSLVE